MSDAKEALDLLDGALADEDPEIAKAAKSAYGQIDRADVTTNTAEDGDEN